MIVYFADRSQNVLGQASTGLPFGLVIVDDTKIEDIETGVASFDLTITYEPKDRLNLEQMTEAGNYVFRSSGTDAECYTIIDAETDAKAKERHLYCEDAGLDLLNIVCGDFEAETAHNIAWYIQQFAGSSGFEIGTNEIPTKTRTLYWDGEATGTERLRSVATQFDNAEISYRFVIENMEITHRYIDIWKKRGVDINQQLRIDRDIDNIIVKRSVANLITACKPTGATLEDEDEPLDLIGATPYDDGDIYLDRQTGILYSRKAHARWARPNGGYILATWSYETEDQEELKNRGISHLKQFSDVEVNYEIDIVRGLESTHIGDRVNIVDDAGEIYVSGRILKLETSVTRQEKQATLGEYLIKTSGLSEQVLQLASDFQQSISQTRSLANNVHILTETVDAMLTLEVQSSVNYSDNTAELTAHLYNGDKEVTMEHSPALYKWILRKDTGEVLLGRGYTYTVDLTQVGYAGTILCRFIRPELYDLTDHNLIPITDQDGNVIQVSYAGVRAEPVIQRNRKFMALNKASNSTNVLRATPNETGSPTLVREVNLYERGNLDKELKGTLQYFWTEQDGTDAGAHITELTKEEYQADPSNSGGNLLAKSDGVYIRDGVEELASFRADGSTIGQKNGPRIEASSSGITLDTGADRLSVRNNLILYKRPDTAETPASCTIFFSNTAMIKDGEYFYGPSVAIENKTRLDKGGMKVAMLDATEDTTLARIKAKSRKYQSGRIATSIELEAQEVQSTVSITVSSDKRLKNHLEYLKEDGAEFCRNLKPALYTKDGVKHLGFYAQDVDAVNKWDAQLTSQNDEGYLGLNYTDLIAPLVAYCQTLEKRIEELEGK